MKVGKFAKHVDHAQVIFQSVKSASGRSLPPETIVSDDIATAAQNVSPETIGYSVAGSCVRGVSLCFPQEHSRQGGGGRRQVCPGLPGAFGVHGSNRV